MTILQIIPYRTSLVLHADQLIAEHITGFEADGAAGHATFGDNILPVVVEAGGATVVLLPHQAITVVFIGGDDSVASARFQRVGLIIGIIHRVGVQARSRRQLHRPVTLDIIAILFISFAAGDDPVQLIVAKGYRLAVGGPL
ncbi:hypothetical protein [Paenibacillus sp. 19GGS1-52]|uniref:hypothetical protein n=1 Tax=Paenibacillus sp. 19GGS1-52 TaxID=2758563 RepID=UPI001EFB8C7C|nr:hypothetical protein [Paenibacillus sp. 19GGS1-52]